MKSKRSWGHRIAVAIVVVVACFAGYQLLVVLPMTMMIRDPGRPPQDDVESLGYTADGVAHAHVEFDDRTDLWMSSSDDGATWNKALKPTMNGYRWATTTYTCGTDDVCYLSHSRQEAGKLQEYRIDRLDPEGTWRNEARFARDDCAPGGLAVSPSGNGRVIADCGQGQVAHRTSAGEWQVVQLAQLARAQR